MNVYVLVVKVKKIKKVKKVKLNKKCQLEDFIIYALNTKDWTFPHGIFLLWNPYDSHSKCIST